MGQTDATRLRWANWAGTETCEPAAIIRATSIEHVAEIVSDATRRDVTVRPVGSGHSFAPLVPTDGILLDVSAISGIQSIDTVNARARVGAGTRISALGEPLWDAGLTLRNQGAIDAQTIAGAMSTSTHGSGLGLKSIAGSVVGAEVVTSTGEVIRFESDDPRLQAVRASMGTLGVIVSLDLQLERAFKLQESLQFWPFAEVLERWDVETHAHRHFSFVRGPQYDMSAILPPIPPGMIEPTLVRIYDTVPMDAADDDTPASRLNRPYRIYPDEFTGTWEEVEPLVPYAVALDAIAACLPILDEFPDEFPLEARTVAGDDAWLSPMYGRDSVAINVCRTHGPDNRPFFEAIRRALTPYEGRPHWGKQPYLWDRESYRSLYPRWDDFVALRRELDPAGTFLNSALQSILE
jgi:FAD/FMN-containing dehydrogenase